MKRRHLPSLNALRVFETAARASSFSAAAEELDITHGAVSRQIAVLETWLGQPLFLRQGQRNVATDHARAFAAEVSTAFDRLSDAVTRFGKAPATRVVRVAAQTTVAMRWLIPRLPDFHASYPDIEIAVSTANTGEHEKLRRFDVLILRAPPDKPEWRYFQQTVLFEERLTVVAAPDLLQAIPLKTAADLANHVFVTSATRSGEWERWLQAAGMADIRPARFQRFDHYHVCLQAVIDGLGIGVGGVPTLSREIEAGRLLAPFEFTTAGSTYSALVPNDVDKTSHLHCFLQWLERQAISPAPRAHAT
ncbi:MULTISPECIES: LysR substrate-binding domain-containing protein [unclassified Achromobacter]|uniref:LysR substrate-binding domain-containing protein n=1 Tax=unclassified Achromobacter TaxID=2626865 RepID=UPI000B519E81|nr:MULTISPECIES: LysR substrate-binding domain-containing protein [unclassified Achromobacter]OWT80817.1 LysR family transcriptional regulator [Achromobacter sp. HZ34]OWT81333.1 LysR family transcriptional regulator [Achromobacter sp. HZ28]